MFCFQDYPAGEQHCGQDPKQRVLGYHHEQHHTAGPRHQQDRTQRLLRPVSHRLSSHRQMQHQGGGSFMVPTTSLKTCVA
jgi:hypothetical protein